MNVKLTIKELGDESSLLKLENGQTVKWPTNYLPKESKVGDIMTFAINDNGAKKEPEQLAKDLLNEILNIN